jgi:hypothetical protein
MKLWTLLVLPIVMALDTFRCGSIFGLETDHRGFMCDWEKPVDYYVKTMNQLGFNSLRIPFSYQYIQEGNLQQLDHVVSLANQYNMSIILDFHRIWSNTQQPTPFDFGVSEQQFTDAWILLLTRYQFEPSIIGGNIWNEFVPTDVSYLTAYSRRIILKIESLFPERYLHFVTGTNWSGSLRGVTLEDLPFKNRIYYSVHKYSFSGTADREDWEKSFGNVGLPLNRIIVGEFGWKGDVAPQVEWSSRFMNYLLEKNITNTCYWSQSQSGDTGNLWSNNCVDFHWDNYFKLKKFWDS